MGANQTLIGLTGTVAAIVEIPFMLFSGTLLRRFGAVRLLVAAIVLMVLRYTFLGWMKDPVWAVPINTLNGPSYVLFWTSAVTYANRLAPKSMAGTAQGLLVSITNLAGVLSSLITGLLFDRLGTGGVFQFMTISCLAALILFTGGTLWLRLVRPVDVSKGGQGV
jgi:PPP family 3-phenylpropionic acid transporter